MPSLEIRISPDSDALARAAAERCCASANSAVKRHGRFFLALAGGSTPRRTYELLASEPFKDMMPWEHVHVFWGDERNVPARHAESNFYMAYQSLLHFVPLELSQIHRFPTELDDPESTVEAYDAELRRVFALKDAQAVPRFDFVFLGLGGDGHTASLFPDMNWDFPAAANVIAPWVPKLKSYRYSLTPRVLNEAEEVTFIVSGIDKARILKQVLEGPDAFPAQKIKPRTGRLTWLIDAEAASELDPDTSIL